jgi:hypothetical protein
MLPQLRQLVVQLIDTPLGNTYILTCVVGFHRAFTRREIGLGVPSHEIVPLHRKSLARTCLTIGEDGSMVTLEDLKIDSYLYDFVNKIREAEALEHICLSGGLGENLVETVSFLPGSP